MMENLIYMYLLISYSSIMGYIVASYDLNRDRSISGREIINAVIMFLLAPLFFQIMIGLMLKRIFSDKNGKRQ